jgi:hypothetical protein
MPLPSIGKTELIILTALAGSRELYGLEVAQRVREITAVASRPVPGTCSVFTGTGASTPTPVCAHPTSAGKSGYLLPARRA